MPIQINPEQEQLIGQAIRVGLVGTAEAAVEMGVGNIRQYLNEHRAEPISPAPNLADLFSASPFAGMNLDFQRDKDEGRRITL